MIKNFNKINYLKASLLVLMIDIIFLNSSSLWFSASPYKNILFVIYLIILIVSLGLIAILNKKIYLVKLNLLMYSVLILSIFISTFLNNSFDQQDALIILFISIGFIISIFIDRKSFVKYYVYLISFITLYSLIMMYIVIPIFPQIKNFFPGSINAAGNFVRNYFFMFHFEDHIAGAKRNTGIFREMGVFQYFINISLMFILFIKIKWKYKNFLIIISILGVISTFSSTGYFHLISILLAYSLNENMKSIISLLFYGISGIIILFVINNLLELNILENLRYTFNRFSSGSSSFDGRYGSIIGNLISWSESPLIGNGIVEGDKIAGENYLFRYSIHNTSTTTTLLSFYGILPGLISIFYAVLFIKKLNANIISSILLLVGIMLSINSQRFVFDPLFFILLYLPFMKGKFEYE